MGSSNYVTGSYVGTGTAFDIKNEKLGFKPSKITVFRKDTRQDQCEWIEGMADASLFLDKGDDGVRSLVSSNGLTPLDDGFTVGTHVGINNSGDTYFYECHR